MEPEENEENTASNYESLTDILTEVLNHKSKLGKLKLDLSGSSGGLSALRGQKSVPLIQVPPSNKENSGSIERVVFPNVSASQRSSFRHPVTSTHTPIFQRSSVSDSSLYTAEKVPEKSSGKYDENFQSTFKSINPLQLDHSTASIQIDQDKYAKPPIPNVMRIDDNKIASAYFKQKLHSNLLVKPESINPSSREKISSDECIAKKLSSLSSTDRLKSITEFNASSDNKPSKNPLDLLNIPSISKKYGAKYNRSASASSVKGIAKVEFPSKIIPQPFVNNDIKKCTMKSLLNSRPQPVVGKATPQGCSDASEKYSRKDADTSINFEHSIPSTSPSAIKQEPIPQQRFSCKRTYPDKPPNVWIPNESTSPPKKLLVEKPTGTELRSEADGNCAKPKIDALLLPSKVSYSVLQSTKSLHQITPITSAPSLPHTEAGAKSALRVPPCSQATSSEGTLSPESSHPSGQSSSQTLQSRVSSHLAPPVTCSQSAPGAAISAMASHATPHSEEGSSVSAKPSPLLPAPIAVAVPPVFADLPDNLNTNPNSIPVDQSKCISVNDRHFIKLKKIGVGGSSIVLSVLDLQDYQNKALKIVTLENLDESILKSHLDEIKVLQKLAKSSRVVKLHEFERTADELKIVMEIGSLDLAAILRDARKDATNINDFTIKHYWNEMLLSVQEIHKEGIIHSDLKPANFLLVGSTLKLIDFGIASSIQKDSTSVVKDNQAGTVNYMSPESLTDIGGISHDNQTLIKIGVKSDIWSLGCILYVLAYGRTPFQHVKNVYRKIQVISNPKTPIDFPPILNDINLVDVLRKCLQYNPKNRPSIRELLDHSYLKSG